MRVPARSLRCSRSVNARPGNGVRGRTTTRRTGGRDEVEGVLHSHDPLHRVWRGHRDERRQLATAALRPLRGAQGQGAALMTRTIEELIAASSIGQGLADIKARGIDAHLGDLEAEMAPKKHKSTSIPRQVARIDDDERQVTWTETGSIAIGHSVCAWCGSETPSPSDAVVIEFLRSRDRDEVPSTLWPSVRAGEGWRPDGWTFTDEGWLCSD